jgi:hypothetical protein
MGAGQLALQYNLPQNGIIGGVVKIADMLWIWEVFGPLISFGS